MNCYKKLRLPANPFKNWEEFIATNPESQQSTRGYFAALDAREHITDEVNDILISVGIKPKSFVIFCTGDNSSILQRRIIHSDIFWDDATRSWRDVHCGINWELGGTNLFSWYDMSKLPQLYPEVVADAQGQRAPHPMYGGKSTVLNGLHFGLFRNRTGIPTTAVKIDETYIDAPTLVRTSVPHLTMYNHNRKRYGISLRIDESNINSWEDALELFKPLYE